MLLFLATKKTKSDLTIEHTLSVVVVVAHSTTDGPTVTLIESAGVGKMEPGIAVLRSGGGGVIFMAPTR